MEISKYHMTPQGVATVRAAATLMGLRLAQLRKQREAAHPVVHEYGGGPIIGYDMPALPAFLPTTTEDSL